jgi:hypothetical protein
MSEKAADGPRKISLHPVIFVFILVVVVAHLHLLSRLA